MCVGCVCVFPRLHWRSWRLVLLWLHVFVHVMWRQCHNNPLHPPTTSLQHFQLPWQRDPSLPWSLAVMLNWSTGCECAHLWPETYFSFYWFLTACHSKNVLVKQSVFNTWMFLKPLKDDRKVNMFPTINKRVSNSNSNSVFSGTFQRHSVLKEFSGQMPLILVKELLIYCWCSCLPSQCIDSGTAAGFLKWRGSGKTHVTHTQEVSGHCLNWPTSCFLPVLAKLDQYDLKKHTHTNKTLFVFNEFKIKKRAKVAASRNRSNTYFHEGKSLTWWERSGLLPLSPSGHSQHCG